MSWCRCGCGSKGQGTEAASASPLCPGDQLSITLKSKIAFFFSTFIYIKGLSGE